MVYAETTVGEVKFNAKTFDGLNATIEMSRGLPNHCYVDPTTHEQEQALIFAQGWICAGFAKDVPEPGDIFPFSVAGMPLVLMRGHDDTIRVFHNVCQHRGRILVDRPQSVKKAIACPYHRWAYDLDGKLVGTPHIGGPGKHSCPRFDRTNVRLREVRSAAWFGLIFIDLSDDAEPFDSFIGPLADRWRAHDKVTLVHTGDDSSIAFTLDCNWKLAVENYCEAYHLPWVHPGLNSYSPLEDHNNILSEGFSGQQTTCYRADFSDHGVTFPSAANLPPFWKTGAEYVSLFPNVLLGLHRDHFFAVLIQPDGPHRTRERFEIFYFDESVREDTYRAARTANRDLWRTVFEEDRESVEAMQRGRHSPGFDGGVFSPAMDGPTHAFHLWVGRAMIERRTAQAAVRADMNESQNAGLD